MGGPPELYFIDENMLSIGKALSAVRVDVVYPGHPRIPEIPRRSHDEHWLPIVGRRGWAVIMRDKRIRRRTAERRALVNHNVRAFCLTGSGNSTSWDMLRLLMRQWDTIESRAADPGPFIYAVTGGGVSQISLSQA